MEALILLITEALTKMLQQKVRRFPGVPKSCVSESDCSGAAKCVDFPKFNKRLCLVGKYYKTEINSAHVHQIGTYINSNCTGLSLFFRRSTLAQNVDDNSPEL